MIRDGFQSIFSTDDKGRAKFEAGFETCMQLSAMLAIAWHSDGKT